MNGFWVFMLIVDMTVPLIMIVFGILFLKKPPKNINELFGYRTTMSMKNIDTWDFAHKYCGRLWLRLGLALMPLSVIAMIFVIGDEESAATAAVGSAVCVVQIVALMVSIIPTENALKKTFDENGIRRS